MVTIPPELPAPRPATHEYRQVAEGFGADAERYDRARPSYPDGLVQRIAAASPGRDVLDVGCGTGIAARLFLAADCDVLGVDPDARMAGHARQRGLQVEVAKFEDWDSAGRQFDTVIAAQAWHWVDPVAGAARAARALRPGGRLAVFWNAFQPPPAVAAAFADVYRRVPTGLPVNPSAARRPAIEAYRAMCATAADGMRRAGGFGEPELWQVDWERPYTRDEWLEFVPTAGGMGQMPPDRLTELLAGIGAAIDAVGGSFVMQYSTVAETAVRA
jgi:SAM-dependent methyltransferase